MLLYVSVLLTIGNMLIYQSTIHWYIYDNVIAVLNTETKLFSKMRGERNLKKIHIIDIHRYTLRYENMNFILFRNIARWWVITDEYNYMKDSKLSNKYWNPNYILSWLLLTSHTFYFFDLK